MWGCEAHESKYLAVHRSARTSIPIAVEMEKQFGSADHFITHYGDTSANSNTWNTEVFFGGRYELTMQIEVQVDYHKRTITPVSDAKFYLIETVRVDSPATRLEASHGSNFTFSAEDWEKVYECNGDFAAIGITLNPEPVAHFEDYVDAMRRPRVPISLVTE